MKLSRRAPAAWLVTALVAAASVTAPVVAQRVAAAAIDLGAGGEFHAIDETRIFDTRGAGVNDVAPLGAKPITSAGATFDVQLLGQGGVPSAAADVLGVMVSITVWNGPASGNLGTYPTGSPPANPTSIINLIGGPVTNVAIVRAGTDGKLTIRLQGGVAGSADVTVDVLGWLSTSASSATDGARLVTVGPKRISDTRLGANVPLAGGSTSTIAIRGAVATDDSSTVVPDSTSVVAAMVNVTAIRPTAATALTVVGPAPVGVPTIANVHAAAGVVKANLVVVPVDANGDIHIYNSSASLHVAVDIVGYFTTALPSTTRAGRMVPLSTPYRTFDTRQPQWGAVALGPGQAENWSFAQFAGSVTVDGQSAGAQSGVLGNLTSVRLTRQYPTVPVQGFMTAYPAGLPSRPTVSNLNNNEVAVVPNMALFTYGTNTEVVVYNHSGYAHYLFDAFAIVLSD